jgi:hypothetical protein
MKTTTTKEVRAAATDQSWQAPDNAASEIINMRLDDSGFGWVNDRGFEPMIPKNTHSALINNTVDDYSRTFVWERHRSSELYVISKRGSELSYEVANNSGLTPTNWKPLHRIGYNRTVAKIDDPDEQYIPFGRLCIIINGKDPMLKFFGRDRVEPFGFTQLTPRPQVLGPDPEYFKGTCTLATPVSTYPYNANDSIGGISFGPGSASGLGNKTDDSTSTYRYKVSFITDTGSESPLSDYEQVSWFNVNDGLTYAVFFQLLPIGPPGTVARRIYRTKNMGTLRGDLVNDTYYFVDQIDDNISKNYYDTKGDQVLVVEAPAQTASDVINNALKYGASWDGRVWLAGGAGTETKIIYSRQGLPEQFPTFSYFDVGNRKGGAITGLIPYYDNLLIFRETSIEVIRSSGSGYICTTLNSNIGTTATNTITVVQGEGVFFLSYDGVYAFKGGVLGGSQLSVVRISDTIQIELNRISRGALAKASASYSFKEKEWWVIYPVDGETENSRGCVYHVQAGGWSFRNANGINDNLFQFNDITTLPSGNFLFSPRRRIQPNVPIFGEALIDPSGLVVWSGKRSGGDILQYSLNQVPTITSTSIKGPLLSTWQSAWFDFGDDSPIKRILSVEVEILTKGHNEIELLSATDYRDDNVISGSRPTVVATIYGTPNEDSLYTPATGSFDKSPAIIGTSRWGEQKPARLRWDVNTGLVSWYRFTLRSTNLFQVVAFNIKYTISDNATPNIRAGERKTI